MVNTLVNIKRRTIEKSLWQRCLGGPVVDKFFAVGLLAGIFGMLALGVHVLLARAGQIPSSRAYHHVRALHAEVQILLFFGSFISGFLLQALPKIAGTHSRLPPHVSLLVAPLAAGFVLRLFEQTALAGSLLLSAMFLAILGFSLYVFRTASGDVWIRKGLILLGSLATWSMIPFLDMARPLDALIAVWGGVGGIICVASQQFIRGPLGGRDISRAWGGGIAILFYLSLASLFIQRESAGALAWMSASISILALLLSYGHASGLIQAIARPQWEPLFIGAAAGSGWAFIGALRLFEGEFAIDSVVHLWSLGWATTLILVIAPRVIGFLCGKDILAPTRLALLVTAWQVVPLGRGFSDLFSPSFAWIVTLVAALVFLPWSMFLIAGISRIIRHQFSLHRGESMVQC